MIDAQISRLRKKIEAGKHPASLIKSVRGVGYVFTGQASDELAPWPDRRDVGPKSSARVLSSEVGTARFRALAAFTRSLSIANHAPPAGPRRAGE